MPAARRDSPHPTTIKGGYTGIAVMQYANKYLSASNPHLVWQICSGFAHGRPWASLGMNETQMQPGSEAGVALIGLTSDRKRILAVTMPGMHLMEDFLRLYLERSQAL